MAYVLYLIEDDPTLRHLLRDALQRYGFVVHTADGDAFTRIAEHVAALQPHLILLDINLPAFDGFYWTRRIRLVSTAPILFISARDAPQDQVRGLEQGGDDYLVKPFDLDVLVARVHALLRRAYGELASGETLPSYGPLRIDPTRSELRYGEQRITLTPTELRLLRTLILARGQPVTRETLLEAAWDEQAFIDDNTLTVNVARLRRKLGALGLPDVLETVRGIGYRIRLPDSMEEHPLG